jgi:hypothetical protein
VDPSPAGRCEVCGRERVRRLFLFRQGGGFVRTCLPCALRYPPLVKRSLGIAALVGTVLLAINQGDVLFSSRWPATLAWKVPLTYLVPYLVATWGALLNSRATDAR